MRNLWPLNLKTHVGNSLTSTILLFFSFRFVISWREKHKQKNLIFCRDLVWLGDSLCDPERCCTAQRINPHAHTSHTQSVFLHLHTHTHTHTHTNTHATSHVLSPSSCTVRLPSASRERAVVPFGRHSHRDRHC